MVNGHQVSDEERVVRDSTEAAAGAVREMAAPPPDHVSLSNGVVLKLKPVSGLLIRRAASQIAAPKPPMWHNADRDRDEPNPNDPDYLNALAQHEEAVGMAAMNVMFIVGTKPQMPLPDGITAIDSDDWIEELAFLDIVVQKEGPGRYLDWLKYVVLGDMRDLVKTAVAVGRMSGLQENDVLAALDSFRGGEERRADSNAPAADSGDGNRVQSVPAGSGAGD